MCREFENTPPGAPLSLKEGAKCPLAVPKRGGKTAPVLAPFLAWALGLGVVAMGPNGPVGQRQPSGMQDSPRDRQGGTAARACTGGDRAQSW